MAQQIKKKFLDQEVISYFDNQISQKAATTYVDEKDAEKLAEAKAYADQKISEIPAVDLSSYETITNVNSKDAQVLADAKTYTDGKESGLQSQINTEKGRIDAILLAADADKDSFAEIVSLINSVDTENDQAFASYVLSNNSALAQEISDRQSGDSALSSELDSLESRVEAIENNKEIIEVDSIGSAPTLGLEGKLYVTKDENKLYRWALVGGGQLTFNKIVGSGELYTTLQSAIDAAVDGENILIKAGTYPVTATINVNKQVKIVGEDKDLVIFQTAGDTSDPVSMFNVSVSNVALAKITIKHRKTSNTSVETAVVASGPGFPQTRIANFIMENCATEFCEFGLTVRAQSWCVRNSTFTYATGSVSNSARAIGIYGTKGNSFIKDVFLKNDVLNGTAFRPFYLTSTTGSNPNETVEGKLVIEGTTHVGPLAQFFNQDNGQNIGAGTFELQVKNNTINESNLFVGYFSAAANAGEMFSSITLSGNTLSNLHAVDGGKGIFGVAGTASFRTSPLIVHASNNTLGQQVYRAGWVSVDGAIVGKETAVPAFTVSSDAVIPETGEIPTIVPAATGGYVEVSAQPDISGIESDIGALEAANTALDSRLDAIEAKGFSKGSQVVGSELGYIDLDRQYQTVLSVSVGRLALHEGEDFTVSVVGGVTRLNWINSIANPDGEEKIETGDKVFWSGSY